MLWLAGLMGLMAVSAAVYVDVGDDTEDDQAADTPEAQIDPQSNIISGSAGADTLIGSGNDDQIGGYEGDDLIDGGAGNDDAHGAEGNDTLLGGAGNDSVHGNDGDDVIYGDDGDDGLIGHNGDDILHGDDGDDSLQGSMGNDQLFGDAGDDALQGGQGDDTLDGGAGQDTLFGGWGNDTLSGIVDDPNALGIQDTDIGDNLNGGGDDDVILTGKDDTVNGGDGADLIVMGDWIDEGHAAQIVEFVPGDDTLLFVWDDSDVDSEAPEISIEPDPDNPGHLIIMMGDVIVANVAGQTPLDVAEISVIPLSSAFASGLIAA